MNDDTYKKEITCIVPVYGQPERTKRLIGDIVSQTINNFELYLIGVACREFQELLECPELQNTFQTAAKNGSDIYAGNLPYLSEERKDDEVFNFCIPRAIGKCTVFCYPSDRIKENHFENYLSAITKTDLDLAFFDLDFDTPKLEGTKKADFSEGNISLKNVIIDTQTLKKVMKLGGFTKDTKKNPWIFLQYFLSYRYGRSKELPTYIVRSTKNHGTFDEID